MRKRIFGIVLAVMLVLSISGCGKKQETAATEQSTETTATTVATVETKQDITLETVRSETYELTGGQDPALRSRIFSEEGVAWAMLQDGTSLEIYHAVINTKGEILYKIGESEVLASERNSSVTTTPFVKGLSAIYTFSNSNSKDSNPGFSIINSSGKKVYSSTDPNLYMCGQLDNGNFVLAKHEAGFDRNDWVVYILDTNLKLTETKIIANEDITCDQYLKDKENNIAVITENIYMNEESIIDFGKNKYYSPFFGYLGRNDKYVFIYNNGDFYFMPINLFESATSEEMIIKKLGDSSCLKFTNASKYYMPELKSFKNGSFFILDENKYVDINDKVVMSYPQFDSEIRYRYIHDFSGGYSAIFLTGKDEEVYATIVDENGKQQYEPKKIADAHVEDTNSCNGYIFYYPDSFEIFAPDGTEKKLGDDLSGLKDTTFIYDAFSYSFSMGNNYIFLCDKLGETAYYSVDGKDKITTFTANYNSDGNLVYTDKDGNKKVSKSSADSTPTTDTTTEATTSSQTTSQTQSYY